MPLQWPVERRFELFSQAELLHIEELLLAQISVSQRTANRLDDLGMTVPDGGAHLAEIDQIFLSVDVLDHRSSRRTNTGPVGSVLSIRVMRMCSLAMRRQSNSVDRLKSNVSGSARFERDRSTHQIREAVGECLEDLLTKLRI